MKLLVHIFLLFVAFGCVRLDSVIFNDCGSDYDLDEVDIVGCKEVTDCVLNRGKKHNINIKLYGRQFSSTSFRQEVHLVLNSLFVPLPVAPNDLCSQVDCPVGQHQNASFTAIMDFTNMPDVQSRGKLHWQIFNNNNKRVMCMYTNVKYEYPK